MTQAISICYITDNKPGHLNQLKGLSEQLQVCAEQFDIEIKEYWRNRNDPDLSWRSLLFKGAKQSTPNQRNIVIGAGHKTHLKMLGLSHKHHAYSVVLMKPSLPLMLFDAAIIPRHDTPSDGPNTLITNGVLNRIKPKELESNSDESKHKLMLIGGASKHYLWNDQQIIQQVCEVLEQDNSIHWTLANSRRTPATFMDKLAAISPSNLSIVDWSSAEDHWLPATIENASTIWVTPDSVSMVYEAITSGAETALFNLVSANKNRINSGVQQLIADKSVTEFSQWKSNKNIQRIEQPLWESNRAARWLLRRFQQAFSD